MIAQDRHRKIVSRIRHSGSDRVTDLARIFDVTEETIRRDLRVLAERGQLIRTHGGALSLADTPASQLDLPFSKRRQTNKPQKQAIARLATGMVEPNEVIAMDASSTVCELAKQLPDIPLTVLTNSLAICSILASRHRVETVCTGGVLDAEARAFMGLQAEKTLDSFNISKFFFSCRGIDLKRGVSEANDRQAALKLRTIELAAHSILLADTSKFGIASSVFYMPADSVDLLITDDGRHDEIGQMIEAMQTRGVKVEQAAVVR